MFFFFEFIIGGRKLFIVLIVDEKVAHYALFPSVFLIVEFQKRVTNVGAGIWQKHYKA